MYYCLSNNNVLLVNIDKFEPNPILVNINKLKPYKYLKKPLKRLEAMIEREREHKEDSQKGFPYNSTKNQTTSKNIFCHWNSL
jgi:hypothetical protein